MYPQIPSTFPPQKQNEQPGLEYIMKPLPIFDNPEYKGSSKLKDKIAIISGGDSGIGRAVAVAFAKEGADIALSFLDEFTDAEETKDYIEKFGVKCVLFDGDLSNSDMANHIVEQTISYFGKIDILVNNCAVQYPQASLFDITDEQLKCTFETNVYSYFYLTRAALSHMKCGDSIINTTSVTAHRGSACLLDYSATKGAITSFTRSLSESLINQGIRVNAVSPGPIWTPLIVSSFENSEHFGSNVPMGRAGQPFECAPAYVYLASDDSRYVSGQIIHINGGEIVA